MAFYKKGYSKSNAKDQALEINCCFKADVSYPYILFRITQFLNYHRDQGKRRGYQEQRQRDQEQRKTGGKQQQSDQEYQENVTQILEWISSERSGKRHAELQSERKQGIGCWLLEAPEFVSWKAGDSCSVLLGHGIGLCSLEAATI